MSAKVTIIKVTADGEQLSVEINLEKRDYDAMLSTSRRVPDHSATGGYRLFRRLLCRRRRTEIIPGKSLRQILTPYFHLMDQRLIEMNPRIIQSNYLVSKLSSDAKIAVHNILEVLHGRRTGPLLEQIQAEQAQAREHPEPRRHEPTSVVPSTEEP